MTAPALHTIPYRHLIGAHLLVPCSDCGGELRRVWMTADRSAPLGRKPEKKHIICRNCHRDYGQDATEMLVEGGRA